MIKRWIIIDTKTNVPHPEGFTSEKECWAETVRLAKQQDRSPYEWNAYEIQFPVQ